MIISMDSDQFFSTVGLVALSFSYIGSYYQYAKAEGTYELKRELRREQRQNEQLREILHRTTSHAAVQPGKRSVNRNLQSVKA
jgi:hypothetical protein